MRSEKDSEQTAGLAATTDIHQLDEEGNTPLHIAMRNNSMSSILSPPDFTNIATLLSEGADITLANAHGLYPHDLIYSADFEKKVEIYKYSRKIVEYWQLYFRLIIDHQPTFKNIKFSLEKDIISIQSIDVSKLSQECLEQLIYQCKQWNNTYLEQRKLVNSTCWDITGIPNYMWEAEELQAKCQRELNLLQEYPYLQEAIEMMTQACYREAVITALMQDPEAKKLFDLLLFQTKSLPLSDKLKAAITDLQEDLEKRVSQNYPVLVELNKEGKIVIDDLFDRLYSAFCERQQQRDCYKAQQSGRWAVNCDFLQRFQEHQPQHKQSYKAVLEEYNSYQRTGGFFETRKRVKCPSAAFECQQLTDSPTTDTLKV